MLKFKKNDKKQFIALFVVGVIRLLFINIVLSYDTGKLFKFKILKTYVPIVIKF